ncbi:hydrolase [Pasteurellaceae bacterium 15-036681]|nr:hydrolase [Pasteurellaceae bacterium 15-036681]
MQSQQYKAVFSDIDGTLVNSQHQISTQTERAIKHILALNIPFILVSARPPLAMTAYMQQLNNRNPLIAFSGALILDENLKPLYSVTIEEADQIALDNELAKFSHLSVNHFLHSDWFTNDPEHPAVKREETIVQLNALKKPEQLICANKVLVIGDANDIVQLEQQLKQQFPQLSIHRSQAQHLEIMHKDASKAKAIRFMENILAIRREEVIAFGDNYNDLDMLEYAGLGVAMANAPEPIKQAAKRVTSSNDDDGVALVLNEIFAKK